MLNAMITTATAAEIDGDLDALQANKHTRMLSDGLDAPIVWSQPEYADDPEQVAHDVQRRAAFEQAVVAAGLPVPVTLRDLTYTMAELGIFERTTDDGVEHWRTVSPLPNPADVLPLEAEEVAGILGVRMAAAGEAFEQAIIRRFEAAGWPDVMRCSVQHLAAAIDATTDEARAGIANLRGLFRSAERPASRPVDPGEPRPVRARHGPREVRGRTHHDQEGR